VLAMPTFISLFVINPLPSEMLCLEIPFQPTLRLPQQGCQPIPPFGGAGSERSVIPAQKRLGLCFAT